MKIAWKDTRVYGIRKKIKYLFTNNNKNLNNIARIGNKIIALLTVACMSLPNFCMLGYAVMATEPEEIVPEEKNNVVNVRYENQAISKAGIYANIYNRYNDTVKTDNYYNIILENDINDINKLKQVTYEDIAENFIEELEREEYYDPLSISLIYKYSNNEYQFGVYEGEDVEFYPESAMSQLKQYIDFEIQRMSISKNEFVEKFGEEGYIKLKNGDEIIGEININSNLSQWNDLYIETNKSYDKYTIETSPIEEETTFVIKLSEKGESTINIIKYEQERSTRYNEMKNTQYISTKVSKKDFDTVLGENGYIQIYEINEENENIQETLIHTINNQSELDEEENYVVNYNTKIDRIKIITSEFIEVGKLYITNTKEIVKDINYHINIVKRFKKLKNNINITMKNGDNTNSAKEENIFLDMLNTKTKATLEINKQALTAIGINENVELKIELNNSTIESDLYANPMFVIELPDGIKNIEINKTDILFDTELKIENVEIIEYNNHKAIKVEISGKETKHVNSTIAKGTNIVINTKIQLEKLLSQENKNIEIYYYNEYATNYENTVENLFGKDYLGHETKLINYIAPTGIFAIQGIENYNSDETAIYSNQVESGIVEGKLKIYSDEVNATSKQIIINNSGNDCEQMIAIGRTMFTGNTNIDTGEDFKTSINTILNSEIKVDRANLKIYYSENGNANEELDILENGWKEEVTDYSKIKSWMIVIDNFEDKEILEFEYDFLIPENLEYCFDMYSNYKISYIRKTETGNTSLKTISNTLKLTTGIGPRMKIWTEVSVGNETEVNEKARIKYTIKVENIGSIDIKNLEIKDNIPQGTVYTEYKERNSEFDKSGYVEDIEKKQVIWNIETLKVGEITTNEFEVIVNQLPTIEEYYGSYPNFTKENNEYYLIEKDEITGEETRKIITTIPDIYITNYATVTAEGFEVDIPSNETKNKVSKIYFEVNETSNYVKEAYLVENQQYKYNIIITNNSDEKLKQIVAQKTIPQEVEFTEAYQLKNGEKIENAVFNSQTKELVWNIAEIDRNEIVQLELIVKAKTLPEGTYEKKVITNTSVTDEKGKKYVSNDVENNIAKPKLNMEVTVKPNTQYVKEKDYITYNIKVTNIGKIALENIKIMNDLPEELVCKSVKYKKGNTVVNTTSKANGDVEINITLKAGEYVEVEIVTTTGKLDKTKNEVDITSVISVEAKNIDKMQERINQIIQVLKEDEVVQEKFKIKGLAWFDENKDGRRDKNEKLIPDIVVYAINTKGQVAGKTKTNMIGEYYFENLEKGEYIVIFLYDSNIYEITQYQVQNVELEINSDVIKTDVILDGQMLKGGVTDNIILKDKSALNIDMGLTSKPEFDLSLNKYVSNILLKTSAGQKVYEYDNKNFAKLDIKEKEIKNAIVMIEYKIEITNEGDISGQVNKIVDYLPKELQFNSELNSNWYLANDGNLYNTELSGKNIGVGETKEVSLILTKTKLEENVVKYENEAEIVEYYNEEGLKDRDSTPGNRQQEDDLSKATLIIAVATGKPIVMYITLTFTILLIFTLGVYAIQKFVLKNKEKGKYR